MATAARELVTTRNRGQGKGGGKKPGQSSPAQAEASRRNGKLIEWKPVPQRKEVAPNSGIFKDETQEEAWQRARNLVRHYVAIGYPADVICRLMEPSLSENTLRKHFTYELENGRLIQDAKVAGTGFYMATSGRHGDMTRFWMRARMGWRDYGETPSGGLEVRFKKIDGDDW